MWNIAHSQRLLLMAAGTATLESIRYSGNGRFIVTGGGDGIARIWDARNSRELVTLAGHRDTVVDASFSRGARSVITASFDGTARLWDTGLANQLAELGHAKGASARSGCYMAGRWLTPPVVTEPCMCGASAAVLRWPTSKARRRSRMRLVWAGSSRRSTTAALQGFGVCRHASRIWEIRVPSPGRRVALSPNRRMMLVAGGRVAQLIDVA